MLSPTVCNPHISITHSTTVVYQNIAITGWQQTALPYSTRYCRQTSGEIQQARQMEVLDIQAHWKVICWTGNKITVLMQNARNPACQQGDRYGPDRPCPLSPMVVSDQCPAYVTYVLICLSRYPVCVRSCQKQIGHRLDMPAHPFFIKHWLSSYYSWSPCFGQFSKPTKARPST